MKRNDWELLFLFGIAFMTFLILVMCAGTSDSFGYEIPKAEAIPFEQMVAHDEEVRFVEWAREEKTDYIIPVTDEDIDLMARVVMSEASILPIEGKQMVATTIVNRVLDGRWGETVEEVVNYPNAYSTADNGEPTEQCYEAVYASLTYKAFPEDLLYFRSGRPHSFGYVYAKVKNTYFTTEEDYTR